MLASYIHFAVDAEIQIGPFWAKETTRKGLKEICTEFEEFVH